MDKSKKRMWINIAITLIILIAGTYYILFLNGGNVETNIAKCIGQNAELYWQTGCPACQRQKDMFGENLKYITHFNCAIDTQKCVENNIEKVPTWIIKGEKYIGVQSLEELKQLTGC